jgi:hypothetical protein
MGVAVIGADLAGFPAGQRHICAGALAKNPLDMVRGIELLLLIHVENVHVHSLRIGWFYVGMDPTVIRSSQALRIQ